MRQNYAEMDCPTWIKQEPFSPVKKTFPDACSPTPIGQGSGDDQLQQAASDALAAGQLLPLIKKELKYTILNRRFANGEADIVLKDKPKPKVKQDLTAADIERKSRRREQNRRAATKCRNKKKGLEDNLVKTFYKEQDKNDILTAQIKTLRSEKAMLEKILEEHVISSECAKCQRDTSYTPPLSAQLPPICYDQNTGSATSPSLYGGDIFTFDVQSNSKVYPMVSTPCTSYIDQTPGQSSGHLHPSPDTFTSIEGPIHVPITPPAEDPSHDREFSWAENYLNISELLSTDIPEEIPVLSSDDLNNLAPPGL